MKAYVYENGKEESYCACTKLYAHFNFTKIDLIEFIILIWQFNWIYHFNLIKTDLIGCEG